jgi:hypothetical protein
VQKTFAPWAGTERIYLMFSSLNVRKALRLTATSVAAGATVALVFLGGPADAAQVATFVTRAGRGY